MFFVGKEAFEKASFPTPHPSKLLTHRLPARLVGLCVFCFIGSRRRLGPTTPSAPQGQARGHREREEMKKTKSKKVTNRSKDPFVTFFKLGEANHNYAKRIITLNLPNRRLWQS